MFGLTSLHGFNAFTSNSTSYIKTIQNVAITIGSGSTSATATITAVTTGNTVIVYRGSDPAVGTNPTNSAGYLTLTNGTTVTAVRQTGTASTTLTLYGTVLEFISSAVNVSAQYVTILVSTVASNTATITSVNTANASIFYLGATSSVAALNASFFHNIALTNSTTVTATRSGTSSSVTVSACIIEWTAAVVKSSQHRSSTIANAAATGTDTITSVSTDNTLLLPGGAYINASSSTNGSCYLSLTNATTVTMTRSGTNTLLNVAYDVLEFQPGVLNQPVQRGTIALTSVTSNTATITSVDTTKAVANFCAFTSADSATTTMTKTTVNVSLTNATTVTAAMDTADASTLTAAYEVAAFA